MAFDLSTLEHPIVQAPMGAGPGTPALAAAVSDAGGLGFLAAGYKSVDAVREEIAEVRRLTDRPFGLNLFLPWRPADPSAVEPYAASLRAEAERYGATLGEPRFDDDSWEAKVALAAEERLPVVSFSFGLPPKAAVDELAAVWVTVTSPAEATAAADIGADALIVQGLEAGAHQGSFDD